LKILVTGGSGYIGSHCAIDLLGKGYDVVAIDNFCNSSIDAINRIRLIAGSDLIFHEGDIRCENFLSELFSNHKFDAVIHFAGLKAVGESVLNPLSYYESNVSGSISLLKAMNKANVKNLVFSSSATVYGNAESMPIKESDESNNAENPYGHSKCMVERIIKDLCDSDPCWSVSVLRYFNPVGAHASGLIGEDYTKNSNNLFPFISKVALKEAEKLCVYGDDYETSDGTCIRDYIHISDLSQAHLNAAELIQNSNGLFVHNLGTGIGYSVMQVIRQFEAASGVSIPFEIVSRRGGDVPICYADPSLAKIELNWVAQRSFEDMVKDTWRWALNFRASIS
jgi:UDP-glucose 4-epimerase